MTIKEWASILFSILICSIYLFICTYLYIATTRTRDRTMDKNITVPEAVPVESRVPSSKFFYGWAFGKRSYNALSVLSFWIWRISFNSFWILFSFSAISSLSYNNSLFTSCYSSSVIDYVLSISSHKSNINLIFNIL